MRSLSSLVRKDRKGQFFILTTVAIVTILFYLGRSLGPASQTDTSLTILLDEFSTFDNIQEKSVSLVKGSESCADLNYNLQEYKGFIENFAKEKNYQVALSYRTTPCDQELGAVAEFSLSIVSDKVDARGNYFVTWP